MTVRIRLRPAILASTLACSLAGCFGSSDDKGDDSGAGKQLKVDASKTGGLGENRGSQLPPPPGAIDSRDDSKPASEPK